MPLESISDAVQPHGWWSNLTRCVLFQRTEGPLVMSVNPTWIKSIQIVSGALGPLNDDQSVLSRSGSYSAIFTTSEFQGFRELSVLRSFIWTCQRVSKLGSRSVKPYLRALIYCTEHIVNKPFRMTRQLSNSPLSTILCGQHCVCVWCYFFSSCVDWLVAVEPVPDQGWYSVFFSLAFWLCCCAVLCMSEVLSIFLSYLVFAMDSHHETRHEIQYWPPTDLRVRQRYLCG